MLNTITRLTLASIPAFALSPAALAGDYIFRIEGTVERIEGLGSINAPFSSAQVGDPVVIDYALFYPGTPDPSILLVNGLPVPGVDYPIDYTQSFVTFGGQSVPLRETIPAPFDESFILSTAVNGIFSQAGVGNGFVFVSTFDPIAPAGQILPSNDLAALAGTTIDATQFLLPALTIGDESPFSLDELLVLPTTFTVIDVTNAIGTSYCGPAATNSTGAEGLISASGSDIAADNDFSLTASGLPASVFGIFITSRTQAFVPGASGASNGNLCLGGVIGRFVGPGQILNSGATGSISLAVDLTQIPEGSGLAAAQAGETWNFQAWHRELVGAGSNLTAGLTVDFR